MPSNRGQQDLAAQQDVPRQEPAGNGSAGEAASPEDPGLQGASTGQQPGAGPDPGAQGPGPMQGRVTEPDLDEDDVGEDAELARDDAAPDHAELARDDAAHEHELGHYDLAHDDMAQAGLDPDDQGHEAWQQGAASGPAAGHEELDQADPAGGPAAVEVIEAEVVTVQAAGASAAGLSQEWHQVQAAFVDDPRGSVRQAAALADAAVAALLEAIKQRQAALAASAEPPDGGGDTTEGLRTALRGYRAFCQDLGDITGRQLQGVGLSAAA